MCMVAFCRKLLGNCNLQRDGLPQAVMCTVAFCRKLLGNCNLQADILPQASVGELSFAVFSLSLSLCFALLWG